MYVIFDAADHDGGRVKRFEDCSNIGVQFFPDRGVFQPGPALLGAENDVDGDFGQGLWHGGWRLSRPVGPCDV